MKYVAKVLASALLSACALASQAATVVTYFHNDASGTPMLATNSAGAEVWRETYRPYGDRLTMEDDSGGNSIGFHGKPFDPNTGLSYMGARYYHPTVGRFMGVDPAPVVPDELQSFNRYAYANNNPYRYVDTDGNAPTPIDVAFLMWDIGKLGLAMYTGVGVGPAVGDVAASVGGLFIPVPGAGQIIKATRAAERAVEAARAAEHVVDAAKTAKVTATELRAAGRADFEAARAGKLAENGGVCKYCGKNASEEVDHVKSLKSYASDVNAGKISKADAAREANAPGNLAGACTPCNRGPGGKHAKELSSEAGPGKWVAPNGFKKD